MKYVKFALFASTFIFAMLFSIPETEAATYETTLGGLVVYLTKAEATSLASKLNSGGDGSTVLGVIAAWIPEPVLSKASAGVCALSGVYARMMARKLSKCSSKGARMTIPWPIGGWGRSLCIQVSSR